MPKTQAKPCDGVPYRILCLDTLPSTNRRLAELARAGEREGLVLMAREQSEGHGRFSRAFYSPRGSGVYMSLLLRPRLAAEQLPLLPPLAAVAAAETAEALSGKHVGIKWVNDLYLCGRKICGILAESGFSQNVNDPSQNERFVVLGIGFNLYTPPSLPPALAAVAGGLWENADEMYRAVGEDGQGAFLSAFLTRFHRYYTQMPSTDFLDGYRARSILIGKDVRLHNAAFDTAKAGEGELVRVLSIDGQGALVVRTQTGESKTVNAGEVTLSLS